MANFSTHVLGAVGLGIVASASLAAAGLLPLASVPVGIGLATLGGIFPDVDSDHSDAIELVFDTLSVCVAAPLMVVTMPAVGLLVGLGLWAASHVLVRYVAILPFRHLTVHRGRIHSIPSGVLLAALVAALAAHGVGLDAVQSWLCGGLFLAGFVLHLILDEMYSVDLGNRKIKRSFGTALKLFERGDLGGYALVYAALAIALFAAPSPRALIEEGARAELPLLPPRDVVERFARR